MPGYLGEPNYSRALYEMLDEARALEKIEAAANAIGSKTMSLQYLDALRTLGAGPATKFVLPMEFTALLRPLIDHAERAAEPKL